MPSFCIVIEIKYKKKKVILVCHMRNGGINRQ